MMNEGLESQLAAFDAAIATDPGSYESHVGRAETLRKLRRPCDALLSYDRALSLRPNEAVLHLCRGAALMDLERLQDALEAVDLAMAAGWDRPEIRLNRVSVLLRLRRYADALADCDSIVAARPQMTFAHIGRGTALLELGDAQGALESFDRAVALQPDAASAHAARGRALRTLGRQEAALASYDCALSMNGADARTLSDRGVVLEELGRFDLALASFDQAIAIQPELAEAHCNRGIALRDLNRLQAALASFDRAIAIDRDFARAHFNRSMTLLADGRFDEGWAALEWRSKTGYGPSIGDWIGDAHLWLGDEALEGRTVLLLSEWGLGDTIQFCRYASLVAARGARVILAVPRPLVNLLASVPGVAQVVTEGDPLPRFDYYCPMLSLPLAFKTTVANVPSQVPYLRSGEERVHRWRSKLGEPDKLRVGLVWSGGFRASQVELWPVNSRRNLPLAQFADLRHPDIAFYSLQKGQPAESELSELVARGWDGPHLIDFTGELNDFADTAALIEHLDLVISVDTSTAHVAGALGKPVWILNRFDSCWRWLTNRDDSPWYPTSRIYSQARPGDWSSVVGRVRADLGEILRRRRAALP